MIVSWTSIGFETQVKKMKNISNENGQTLKSLTSKCNIIASRSCYSHEITFVFYFLACPRPDNVKHTIRGNIINVTWSSSCSLVESFWVEINNHGVLFRNFSNLTPSTTYLVFDIDICGEIKLSISVRAVNKAGSSRPGNLSIEIGE